MGRGSFNGGSTVIGPGSNWFSKPLTKAEKERQRREDEARLEAVANRRKAARLAAKAEVEAQREKMKQARAERRASPEYQAAKAEERASRKRNKEARKALAQASQQVDVYIKTGNKLILRPKANSE